MENVMRDGLTGRQIAVTVELSARDTEFMETLASLLDKDLDDPAVRKIQLFVTMMGVALKKERTDVIDRAICMMVAEVMPQSLPQLMGQRS